MRTLFILALLLAGCGSPWKPVMDPRASKEPREIIRDTLECERLLAEVDPYGGVPLAWRADTVFLGVKVCWWDCGKHTTPSTYNPMFACLTNRGHSIINWK